MRLLIFTLVVLSQTLSFTSAPLSPEDLLQASETIGDPESPRYDEDAYCEILTKALDSPLIDEAERLRASVRLETAKKNRPGTMAADFPFIGRDNSATTLYDIKSEKPILLIFYDPDCSHCVEVFNELRESGIDRNVTILAVDAEDDKEMWDQTAAGLPAGWTVGYTGPDIQDNETYVFLTSPAMYLLTPDKRVILKDATVDRIRKALD